MTLTAISSTTCRFVTYFDASQKGLSSKAFLIGGFFALVGLVGVGVHLFIRSRGHNTNRVSHGLAFFAVVLALSVVFTGLVVGVQVTNKRDLLRAPSHVVEGRVKNFVPDTSDPKEEESFTVGRVSFDYGVGAGIPGFSQTRSQGGPIREGLRVRITWARHGTPPEIVTLQIWRCG